ncbi:MAG: glycosyltransferase 61 family protein [Pseudomonadota bacterium]
MPTGIGGYRRWGGAQRSDGSVIPESRHVRNAPLPVRGSDVPVEAVDHLPGRHLFAGPYLSHFGHFFAEGISRLHAYRALRADIDGIVFIGRQRGGDSEVGERAAEVLQVLGVNHPVRIIAQPTRVDALFVPDQGAGLGLLAGGTPATHAMFREAYAEVTARPDGAARVLISRRYYGRMRGGVVLGGLLEENLEAQGYQSFAPERHSFAEQVATYKAARQIVGLDSSAFHVIATLGRADLDVGVILRRADGTKDLGPQLLGFTGRLPTIIDAIEEEFVREGAGQRRTWSRFAELDFPRLGRELQEAGLIDDLSVWQLPTPPLRQHFFDRYAKRFGKPLVPYRPAMAGDGE